MGLVFSRLFAALFGKREIRILILGLDNAGKTTILYKLQLGEVIETVPSKHYTAIGFNVETIVYHNLKLQVWDLGGQGNIRPFWRCYYPNTSGIVYVVDSADRDRIDLCRNELVTLLQEEDLKTVPLLIFANKQDLPNPMSHTEVSERLGLVNLKTRQWSIFGSSAVRGDGVAEGMDWLVSVLKASA